MTCTRRKKPAITRINAKRLIGNYECNSQSPLPFAKGEDEGEGLFEERQAPHLNPLPAIGERRINPDRFEPTFVDEHGTASLQANAGRATLVQ